MTDFVIGSIQNNLFFRCGNKNCKCHDKKILNHMDLKLTFLYEVIKKNFYIKKERIKDIQLFVKNYNFLWQSLLQLSLLNYKIYCYKKILKIRKKNSSFFLTYEINFLLFYKSFLFKATLLNIFKDFFTCEKYLFFIADLHKKNAIINYSKKTQ